MEYINKQIKKDFMKNKSYIIVLFLLALFTTSMYLFIRYSIDTNVKNINAYVKELNQEDFRFNVNVFYDEQVQQEFIQSHGINQEDAMKYGLETVVQRGNIDTSELEESMAEDLGKQYNFSVAKRAIKKVVEENSTYYVVNDLVDINKTNVLEGKLPEGKDEVAVFPAYAEKNNLKIGDMLTVNGKAFTIVAYIYLPDYLAFVPEGELEQSFEHATVCLVSEEAFVEIQGHLTQYFCGKYNSDVDKEAAAESIREDDRFSYFKVAEDIEGDWQPMMGFKSNTGLAVIFLSSFLVVSIYVYFMFYKKFIQLYRRKFGVYKALGFTTRKVINALLQCTLPYILLGSIAGVVAGYFLADVLVNRYIETYCFNGFAKGCSISSYAIGILSLPILNSLVLVLYIIGFYKEDAALLMKDSTIKMKVGVYTNLCNALVKRIRNEKKTAYRMLLRKKSNIVLTYAAIALVSTLFTTSISLYRSSGYNIVNQFEGMNYTSKTISSLYDEDQSGQEEFIQTVGEVTIKDEKNNFNMMGLEEESQSIKLFNNHGESVIGEDDLIISEGVSILYHLKVGDMVTIKVNQSTYNEMITDICTNGNSFTLYMSKSKLAKMLGVSPSVHNGVFYTDATVPTGDMYTKVITIDEERASAQLDASSNQSSAVINQVIAVLSGLLIFYLTVQISFQDSKKDIFIMRRLGYTAKEIFNKIIDVYKGLIVVFYLITYPLAIYISKMIHVSVSKQTNDYIPFSTNPLIFIAGFILVFACYEIIVECFKLQMSRKMKSAILSK